MHWLHMYYPPGLLLTSHNWMNWTQKHSKHDMVSIINMQRMIKTEHKYLAPKTNSAFWNY